MNSPNLVYSIYPNYPMCPNYPQLPNLPLLPHIPPITPETSSNKWRQTSDVESANFGISNSKIGVDITKMHTRHSHVTSQFCLSQTTNKAKVESIWHISDPNFFSFILYVRQFWHSNLSGDIFHNFITVTLLTGHLLLLLILCSKNRRWLVFLEYHRLLGHLWAWMDDQTSKV